MTHQPYTSPHAAIQAALEDWWIHADLDQSFEPPTVATQVELYLTASGYTITPDIPRTPMPTRASITLACLLALICLGTTIAAATNGDWTWALASLIGAGAFTYEAGGDIAERHHRRTTRPGSRHQ
ncbi:hypothetical protein [Streptomyces sp. AK08-02]|uniref:hypothetical protein n=1 Tax=Streptomyces sp. AK08-02 TaxID=3028654 RepID=UPI0029A1542F|nr:hypothetical protein [Streptomyces sp. AK08-02]MDX3748707.1 hypothetical protein [Streptomyces sp. AK08-02]